MPPLVSIGLPVYNGARTLERVLNDLRRQEYPHLEIIVSDNCSTDESLAIARGAAAADPRIRVVTAPVNRGAIWNFNRVFELATGEFFMWAAHDDRRHASYVARCLPVLLGAPDVAVCHTQIAKIDPDGRSLGSELRPLVASDDSPRRRFVRTLAPLPFTFAIYGLMRRSFLERTQGALNYYGSDLGLVSELALYGKIVQLPEPLFTYCQRPPEQLDTYLARLLPMLHPDNRYRPWVPLRALIAREYLVSIRRSPVSPTEKLLLAGDVAKHFLFGEWTRADLLRMAVAGLGPARVERMRAWKRRRVQR